MIDDQPDYYEDEDTDVYIKRDKDIYRPEWSRRSANSYSLGTQTKATLPPGIYRIRQDGESRIVFDQIDLIKDELIDLQDPTMQGLKEMFEKFWASKEEYERFGQVYKRGVLLHGKQGCGKTALLTVLFTKMLDEHKGIVLYVENPELAMEALKNLRQVEPERKLIMLYEDLDAIIDEHKENQVLSILDGEFQTNNVFHLATTNYLEKVPERLKNRPSRLDEVVEMPLPSEQSRTAYIEFLFSKAGKTPPKTILQDTEGLTISHIKELFISVWLFGKDYKQTLTRLRKMGEKTIGMTAK